MDATKYLYERKYSTSNEQFWDIFPDKIFPWQFPDCWFVSVMLQ